MAEWNIKLTRQQQRVLDFIRLHGGISPIPAWHKLSVYRLSAVIFDLKEAGYKFKPTRRIQGVNKYGERCVFARYELDEVQESFADKWKRIMGGN